MTVTRFTHAADLHFGAQNDDALETFAAFVRDRDIDGVVIAGDITQRGTREEFDAFRRWTEKIEKPMVCVPGNHDTPRLDLGRRASLPFGRFRNYAGHIPDRGVFGQVALHGLNTARGWQMRWNWAEGSIRESDLVGALSSVGTKNTRLSGIVCHHPLIQPPKSPLTVRTRRGQWASSMIARSDVDLVLSGHVHMPSATWRRTKDGGYLAISSGTLSTRLREHPPSFNLISVFPDRIEIEAMEAVTGSGHHRMLGTWRIRADRIVPHAGDVA